MVISETGILHHFLCRTRVHNDSLLNWVWKLRDTHVIKLQCWYSWLKERAKTPSRNLEKHVKKLKEKRPKSLNPWCPSSKFENFGVREGCEVNTWVVVMLVLVMTRWQFDGGGGGVSARVSVRARWVSEWGWMRPLTLTRGWVAFVMLRWWCGGGAPSDCVGEVSAREWVSEWRRRGGRRQCMGGGGSDGDSMMMMWW